MKFFDEDMMELLRTQYELKELELNALLEVTQAINNNLPEESLYKIFNFTLRANLDIKKLALYVYDEREENDKWVCKTYFGTEKNYPNLKLDKCFLPIQEVTDIENVNCPGQFEEFDKIIPVAHKDRMLAFVFVGGLYREMGINNTETGTTFIQALSNIIIVAVENKKLARRQLQEEALRKEMEIARDVQQYLFPEKLPRNEGLQVVASYFPHYSVGGDYYDYLPIGKNEFLICIADVSGKGVPAALLMSNFQAALRTLVRQTNDLKTIVHELNYQVKESGHGENYITFFIARYNSLTKKLNYINAGHIQPVLIRSDGRQLLLDQGTIMLGAFDALPFLNEGELEQLDDFSIFAYTDGLTETFNENEEEYGTERLQDFLSNHRGKSFSQIHHNLIEELKAFSGQDNYHDDITILSMYINTLKLAAVEEVEG